MNPRPAVITEAAACYTTLGDLLCNPYDANVLRQSAGIHLGLIKYYERRIAARFLDYGADNGIAYCKTYAEDKADSLFLRGYVLTSDYPNNPSLLVALKADGGQQIVRAYTAEYSGTYALYDWAEQDSLGRESPTLPFAEAVRVAVGLCLRGRPDLIPPRTCHASRARVRPPRVSGSAPGCGIPWRSRQRSLRLSSLLQRGITLRLADSFGARAAHTTLLC